MSRLLLSSSRGAFRSVLAGTRPTAAPREFLCRRHAGGATKTSQGEGRMFGEDPDAPWEGWEPVVYVAYTASFLLLFFGLGYKPQTNIHQWAREEAIARIEAEERGEKVVFGKHYSTFKEVRYEKGEAGEIPQLFEGEVDEDEDE